MYVNAVEDDKGCYLLGEADVQTSNHSRAIVVGSVRNAAVGCDGQTSLALQVLAHRRVEALAGRRSDSIRAGAKYQCRPSLCF